MQKKYDHGKIEKKWQDRWQKEGIYSTPDNIPEKSKKRYVLDMFPYPSGSTMHVGHLEGYVGTDILSRYLRMNGYSVLHPMGWDAFGLPAENYAIKTGINPDKSTHDNINTFKRQLEISGLSYDWSRQIDTSSPEFYKWTQWLFLLMFKKGLAYKKKSAVNWCPKDETVLANEQVVNGCCERCDTPVIQKELDQWFFRITDYADKLISGLDDIDWPEDVKIQQKNWIGRSEGMLINFKKEDGRIMPVFTTRPDTLNAVTFIAVTDEKLWNEGQKEKLGENTGEFALNPLNSQKVPIWKTNYIAPGYGTGVVMGVPAHDERDMEFAKKYHLDIVEKDPDESLRTRIEKEGWGKKHTNYHLRDWLISRQRYWGCPIPMIFCEHCASKGISFKGLAFKAQADVQGTTPYMSGMEGWFPVEEKDLPVLLPTDVDFLPHGESPIAGSKTFREGVKCPKCGKDAKREVDTMDTYVDSSWYFMAYPNVGTKEWKNVPSTGPSTMSSGPNGSGQAFLNEKIMKAWLPVDDYVGGGHVVQHLLFARFFWKVLFDSGLIEKSLGNEPFLKLRAPGWILGSDFKKMSKRWGNVVTPDEIIPKFGADTLRVYEMFMGPFDVMKPWSVTGVEGAYRFLGKVWRLFNEKTSSEVGQDSSEVNVLSKLHQTIKKVTNDIEGYKFNTAISSLMELVNTLTEFGSLKTEDGKEYGNLKTEDRNSDFKHQTSIQSSRFNLQSSEIWSESLKTLCLLLAPFAPHMAEEIWHEVLGFKSSVHKSDWPKYDDSKIVSDTVTMIVQVNGKVRGILNLSRKAGSGSARESEVTQLAKKDGKIAKWLEGKTIIKTIFVPEKIINFVIS